MSSQPPESSNRSTTNSNRRRRPPAKKDSATATTNTSEGKATTENVPNRRRPRGRRDAPNPQQQQQQLPDASKEDDSNFWDFGDMPVTPPTRGAPVQEAANSANIGSEALQASAEACAKQVVDKPKKAEGPRGGRNEDGKRDSRAKKKHTDPSTAQSNSSPAVKQSKTTPTSNEDIPANALAEPTRPSEKPHFASEPTTDTTSSIDHTVDPSEYASNFEQQLSELELLRCMYCDDLTLKHPEDDERLETLRHLVDEKGESLTNSDVKAALGGSSSRLSFTVQLVSNAPTFVKESIEAEAPFSLVVEVTFPRAYPASCGFEWLLDAPLMSKTERDELLKVFNEQTETFKGTNCVQAVLEAVKEKLLEVRQDMATEAMEEFLNNQEEEENLAAALDWVNADKTLGRRCIYFHHILGVGKRQCISSWTRQLKLNGFTKIGYPGVLILEGPEIALVEFVRCLQRLRWKLMVVRGEESFPVPEGKTLDDMRKITTHTGTFEIVSSSEIGEYCNNCGLGDLFRTSMKIYKN